MRQCGAGTKVARPERRRNPLIVGVELGELENQHNQRYRRHMGRFAVQVRTGWQITTTGHLIPRLAIAAAVIIVAARVPAALVAIASRVDRMSPQMTVASGRDAPGQSRVGPGGYTVRWCAA